MTKAPSFSLVNSNYFQLNKKDEDLCLITASKNLGNKANISLGAGVDVDGEFGDKQAPDIRYALEAKIKYNINDDLNAQFRYRRRGNTEQYRVTFGGSHKIDKHQSIYASAHVTANKKQTFSANAGGWIGYTYKFDNGISISAEAQANCPIGKDVSIPHEIGNKGNYMVNLITSIPLF